MTEALWVAIPGISDSYQFVIDIQHREPIHLGSLGLLLWALDENLRASSGRYIASQQEFRGPLRANKFRPFDAALRLSFEGAERGSWKVVAGLGGGIASALVYGLLVNNVDRIFQVWGADAARYVQNPSVMANPPPVERTCEKAIDAAQKMNATRVTCSITGQNGVVAAVEIVGPNTPRRPVRRRPAPQRR